jgi:hypothetical protein
MEEANQEGVNKFNNCKHRSIDEQSQLIKRCSCQGGNYYQQGYFCNARQIFGVTPIICMQCDIYESR